MNAGRLDYAAGLALQDELHARLCQATGAEGQALSGYLVVVEHPPVLTLGKHANPGHLKLSVEAFAAQGVAVVRTERGGEVTAHMPGQLVVYPILRLRDFGLSPRAYVGVLEQSVIATLAAFGLAGHTDAEHPGVWLGQAKVCALGVRIKNRVSLHGLALNVANPLALFSQIVPCGIVGRGVTSISRELQTQIGFDQVVPLLVKSLTQRLEAELAVSRRPADLQWEEGLSTI